MSSFAMLATVVLKGLRNCGAIDEVDDELG
jgi:hypothetical protein